MVEAVRQRRRRIDFAQAREALLPVAAAGEHVIVDARDRHHVATLGRQAEARHARRREIVQVGDKRLTGVRNRLHAVEGEKRLPV